MIDTLRNGLNSLFCVLNNEAFAPIVLAFGNLMRNRDYQQCSRCVMDTTDLQITFDELGHCNHCTEFLDKRSKHQYQGGESDTALDRLVESIKRAGKGNEYDCVIGVSGGTDSSYL